MVFLFLFISFFFLCFEEAHSVKREGVAYMRRDKIMVVVVKRYILERTHTTSCVKLAVVAVVVSKCSLLINVCASDSSTYYYFGVVDDFLYIPEGLEELY